MTGSDADPALRRLADDLHARLAATAELPVETEAGRWLGEAEAVAADAAGADVPEAVVEKRAEQVRRLLAEVDATGHPDADEHVAAARDLAAEIAARRRDDVNA